MLLAKEEKLLGLVLLKEIEEEIPMDELEADLVKAENYQDNIAPNIGLQLKNCHRSPKKGTGASPI